MSTSKNIGRFHIELPMRLDDFIGYDVGYLCYISSLVNRNLVLSVS